MVTFLIVSIILAAFIVIGVKLNTYLYRNGALRGKRETGFQDMIFSLEAE